MRAIGLGVCLAVLMPGHGTACKCQSQDVCAATQNSNAVFAGTVESITPDFMMRWMPPSRDAIQRVNQAHERYLADRSTANFSALKEAVRASFPGLGEQDQQRLEKASGMAGLVDLFSAVLEGSRLVRFRVRTVFRMQKDDDKDDDDDEDAANAKTLDVVTPFDDCGNDFQIGETYLVYATSDEESPVLATDACTRTRRLSDAGADLAYLYFYKDRKKNPSGRIQGFTTYDTLYQTRLRDADHILEPSVGTIVELKSSGRSRYTTSNEAGWFVFDGLDGGDYSLTAFGPGFPAAKKVLSGPQAFHVEAKGCASRVLLLPKE